MPEIVDASMHLELLLQQIEPHRQQEADWIRRKEERSRIYRERRNKLKQTIDAAYSFPGEQTRLNSRPSPAGFSQAATRFVALGKVLNNLDLRSRLGTVATCGVPSLECAAAIILLG